MGKATTDVMTGKSYDAEGSGNSLTNVKNTNIKAAAAIALDKLAATTASRALVSDGSGFVSPATTTATEIGYVNGVTSSLCGINQSCTLTSKTLTSPTITGPSISGTIGTALTASKIVLTDGSSNLTTGTPTVAQGGTGLTSGTSGGVPYFSSSSALSSSAALAQYGVVLGGGAGATPATLAPNASTAYPLVSGGSSANPSWALLGVTGGGTGIAVGTSGGIPYFSGTTTIASSGALTASQLVLGGGTGATPTSLAAGSQYQVLTMGASNPAYG